MILVLNVHISYQTDYWGVGAMSLGNSLLQNTIKVGLLICLWDIRWGRSAVLSLFRIQAVLSCACPSELQTSFTSHI